MYFNNEKEDTNIDKEFSNKKKINFKNINFKNIDFKNFDFGKFKIPLFILGGIILLFVILLIVRPKGDKVEYFIRLEGGEDITVYKGEEFIDPGYYGYDTNGKDYTDKISIDSSVDSNKIGDYEVIYKLNDVSVKRTVSVIEKPIGATQIYLKGESTISVKVNSEYTEPGYEAVDSVDSVLTDKVTVSGRVDTKKVGTYIITYSVVNSSGVTTSVKRTVIVK